MAGNRPDSQIDVAVRRALDASVGAAVIGRRTLESRCRPWGGTPWSGVPSVVVTHRASPDLLGELRLHLVPLLLDAGTPLFDGGSRPS
jgi:hypothetical protein